MQSSAKQSHILCPPILKHHTHRDLYLCKIDCATAVLSRDMHQQRLLASF